MEHSPTIVLRARGLLLTLLLLGGTTLTHAASSFIGSPATVSTLSFTVPSHGDVNPCGVAQVPVTEGNLVEVNPFTRQQVATNLVDNPGSPPGSGAPFGRIATPAGVYSVADAANTFNLLH